MWFRFTSPFDFSPAAFGGRVTIAYKPGVHNVTRECAEKVRAAGVGKPVKAAKGKAEDGDQARGR